MVAFNTDRFVDPVSQHLMCSICHNVFDTAVITKCGHTFCRDCLDQWLTTDDQKECPDCRQVLSARKTNRKRTSDAISDNNNGFLIGGDVVVTKNIIINSMISELRIRCHYESVGCPEVVAVQSLPTHLKTCGYKLCHSCGLSDALIAHNCTQLTRNAMNEWRDKYKAMQKKYKSLDNELKTSVDLVHKKTIRVNKLSEIEVSVPFIAYSESVMMGTYKTHPLDVIVASDGIKISGFPIITGSLYYHIFIPFTTMRRLSLYTASTFTLLCIRPTIESSLKIKEFLNLGNDSPDELRFDVMSSDPKQQNILIVLKRQLTEKLAKTVSENCKRLSPDADCQPVDANDMNDKWMTEWAHPPPVTI
ncbi:unnamed protein product [Oppiella nova]|uniref:RING-type domain-containing protein n=1 Tax=Oppiella nova TaxID=334625 RepID=A0A7R9QHH7_9ACAR|nr:unnamed protein product [Oppiella nova]CAG2166049.1 unnamed protein product [Oppiella nova]